MLARLRRVPFAAQVLLALVAGRRPRARRPGDRPRRRRHAQLADQHAADHRRHLRDAAEGARPAADRHRGHRQHRQPQAGLQRRPPGRPDPALVRDHRADRRLDRHRPGPAHPARPQQLRRRRRPADARDDRLLVGLPHRPGARQHPRPAGRSARRRHDRAVVQRAAADRASSVAIGIAALKVGEPAEPFLGLVRSALAIVQKVLWWVILLAPIGTRRPDRQRGGHLRLGVPRLARRLRRRGLRRASRWCCSSSTRCCCGCTASRRCATSPAPGRPSSWPSSPAPRSAPCR